MSENRKVRRYFNHQVPDWVKGSPVFFLTVCAEKRGMNVFCNDEIKKDIVGSIEFKTEQCLWDTHLLLLMPDHIHMLVSFSNSLDWGKDLSQWKRYLARKSKIKWQRDFFDHRIRSSQEYDLKYQYILLNPVRAKLIENADGWKWVWSKNR